MFPRSDSQVFGSHRDHGKFDAEAVRWILGKAAAEQARQDTAHSTTYSLEELEEMATEAGISRDALRVAISRNARRAPARRRVSNSFFKRPGFVYGALGSVALIGLMMAFPMLAYAFFWLTVVFGLLLLLGATPF